MGTGWDIVPAWEESPASERAKLEAARKRVQSKLNLGYVKVTAVRAFLRAGRTRWQAR